MINIAKMQEMLGYISWRVRTISQRYTSIPDADRQAINDMISDMQDTIEELETSVLILDHEVSIAYNKSSDTRKEGEV